MKAGKNKGITTIAPAGATIDSVGTKASTGPITVAVESLRFYEPHTSRFVGEVAVKPGALVLSGENRGHRAADGRIYGTFAGFFAAQVDGATQEQAFVSEGWTSGFEPRRKGNPGKRDRDIALAMAVGFEEYKHRVAGKSVTLTAIFEVLAGDVKWRLSDLEILKNAYFRGHKILQSACFAVVAITPQLDDESATIDVFALVKERSTFNSEPNGDWVYVGFPWFWRRDNHTIEQSDPVCPMRLASVSGVGSYDMRGTKVKDS